MAARVFAQELKEKKKTFTADFDVEKRSQFLLLNMDIYETENT